MAPAAAEQRAPPRTVEITLKDPAYLNRSWPPWFVAVILLVIAGNMIAYPLWCLLFSKYQEERDSLVDALSGRSPFVQILDALSQGILETAPRMVAGLFLLYIGLCSGYVGIASLKD